MYVIVRTKYCNMIEPFIGNKMIKILTGIRRSGKSTLMMLIKKRIIEKGFDEDSILYINFESMKHIDLRNTRSFYDHVMKWSIGKGKVCLFFDEIQIVDKWEEALNSYIVDLDADIYITGSNSNMLSSELSTLLTGRYISFKIMPLTFTEVLDFQREINPIFDEDKLLWDYIRCGGFPSVHISTYDEETCHRIVSDIYDSVILRDVVQRFSIRNIELLNRIIKYITDNIGNTFSAKSISDYFKSQQRKVDLNTVYNYIEALESSYIVSRVNRYDLYGKEILKTQEKFYLADHGIQHAIFGYRDRNISGILENIVYNDLKMKGYQVYVGKIYDSEIDFVAEKHNERIYVQVAYQMNSEKTISREFKPLLMVKDHYPKYVVSMDSNFSDNIEGVRHIYLKDFVKSTII